MDNDMTWTMPMTLPRMFLSYSLLKLLIISYKNHSAFYWKLLLFLNYSLVDFNPDLLDQDPSTQKIGPSAR